MKRERWNLGNGKGKDECRSEMAENKMIKVAQEISGSHFDSCVGALS